jgi:hypothetical protein
MTLLWGGVGATLVGSPLAAISEIRRRQELEEMGATVWPFPGRASLVLWGLSGGVLVGGAAMAQRDANFDIGPPAWTSAIAYGGSLVATTTQLILNNAARKRILEETEGAETSRMMWIVPPVTVAF